MGRTLSVLTSTAALAAVLTAVAVSGPASPASAEDNNDGRTKNVIYLLGDGMGRTHVTAGRERFYGANGRAHRTVHR